MNDKKLALFVMLGQTADRGMQSHPFTAAQVPLTLSDSYDLSILLPESVKRASSASEAYKLFFVFEDYLRDLVLEILAKDDKKDWWESVPEDIRAQVQKLEETEEVKRWMAIESRNKSALLTLPQILKIIDDRWADGFSDVLRDKGLIAEARLIVHLRNTICHMSDISDEELARIRQVMRDWFRVVAP